MRGLFVNDETPIGCVVSDQDVTLLQANPDTGVVAAARAPRCGGAVCEALRQAYEEGRFRGHDMVTCMANRAVTYRRLLLPPMPTEDVAAAAAWRLAKEIDQDPEDLRTDYYDLGDIFEGAKHKREIIAVGAAVAQVRDLLAPIMQCEFTPVAVDTVAGAVARCVTSSDHGDACLVIDLHDGAANIMIAEAGSPQFIHVLQRLEIDGPLKGVGARPAVPSTSDVRRVVDELAREINICAHYLSNQNSSTALPTRACVIGVGRAEEAIAAPLAKAAALDIRPATEFIDRRFRSTVIELERESGAGTWLLPLGLALYEAPRAASRSAA